MAQFSRKLSPHMILSGCGGQKLIGLDFHTNQRLSEQFARSCVPPSRGKHRTFPE